MADITVMVVEDEAVIGMDIRNTLKRLGYRVPPVISSGEKALEKVANLKPDLVLMDIILNRGNLDGIDTAKTIRDRHNLPVVFLTAHTDTHTLDRAKATQPFGYIVKPFEERDLQTTIEIALARYKAELEMKKALEKERELNELKTRFVAMVSHEFRTPLTTIMGSTELLAHYSHKWSDEKKNTHFKRISASVQHMTQMLDDILTLGKSESNLIDFHPQTLDIALFCQNLVDEFNVSYNHSKDCPVDFKVKNELKPHQSLLLDDKLLRSILSNLLSNAIKYSSAGSSINLELTYGDREAIFTVADRGIGIPEADCDRIFESFHRGQNVATIQGTGLGLAIVKKSVDLHGGTIDFTSREGEGTTFTVTLPSTQPNDN